MKESQKRFPVFPQIACINMMGRLVLRDRGGQEGRQKGSLYISTLGNQNYTHYQEQKSGVRQRYLRDL